MTAECAVILLVPLPVTVRFEINLLLMGSRFIDLLHCVVRFYTQVL